MVCRSETLLNGYFGNCNRVLLSPISCKYKVFERSFIDNCGWLVYAQAAYFLHLKAFYIFTVSIILDLLS